jgi:hypothetical protein
VFPLDQPARILAAIARTLPVQIDSFTAYWITLRPRAPPEWHWSKNFLNIFCRFRISFGLPVASPLKLTTERHP